MGRMLLMLAGACTLLTAAFQVAVSFSPSWSLYLGAPKWLAARPEMLLGAACRQCAVKLFRDEKDRAGFVLLTRRTMFCHQVTS